MIPSEFFVAPGNDYRGLAHLADRGNLTATVVIPVYNRVTLLENVIAGLTNQTTASPFDVVVVDDGSDEDVAEAVARSRGDMSVNVIRQDRSGRGAGRARNRGALASDADVLIFLDADCIPGPEYIETHMIHHRKAVNVVVTASRRHIDRPVSASDVEAFDSLLVETGSPPQDGPGEVTPDDWRRVFYRRNQSLLLGDAAYRAALSGLMSVARCVFEDVGGFDERFRQWGGEDTEFGWRLWNHGCFIVPENSVAVIHQRSEDLEGRASRERSRKDVLALVADRVPHRFYRNEPSHLYSVPKLSLVVTVGDAQSTDRAWQETTRASVSDTELIVVGGEEATGARVSGTDSRDFSVVRRFRDAVEQSRGELIAVIDGRSRFDRRLLGRVLRRFDDSNTGGVRVGYRAGGSRALSLKDLDRIDRDEGQDGLPFLCVVKRRELMKDPDRLDVPGSAVAAALERSSIDLFVTDLVEVPSLGATSARLPGLGDLRAAGAAEIARGVKRSLANGRPSASAAEPSDSDPDTRVPIAYVGLPGQKNLGDDAMLEAIRGLMPWAHVDPAVDEPKAVMLGGGTLLNADGYYLNRIRRVDGPTRERLVFGTGMRSTDYWGTTERIADWEPFLATAMSVGVRGPLSKDGLQEWGFDGDVQIIGDPALALTRPQGVGRVEGRVVLSPLHTGGECWGSDDAAVLDAYAGIARELHDAGHELTMLTAHPSDDQWAIEAMRASGLPDMAYVPGHADMAGALDVIASSDLVVGERLHSVVLAAAMGTPFVAVEYRPKVRDFAASIGAEAWCLRTDEIGGLRRLVSERLASSQDHQEAVNLLRSRLSRYAGDAAQFLQFDV